MGLQKSRQTETVLVGACLTFSEPKQTLSRHLADSSVRTLCHSKASFNPTVTPGTDLMPLPCLPRPTM